MLDNSKDSVGDGAEDEEAQDRRRGPRVCDAAKLKAEEKHEGRAREGQGAEPVNGKETLDDGGLGSVNLEEKYEDGERDTRNGNCDSVN
jgi:hypothetical protein